jgi:uncharacterized protein YoxC
MTNEELNQAKGFTLEQQAISSARMDRIEEIQARTDVKIEALTSRLGELTEIVVGLAGSTSNLEESVSRIEETVFNLSEKVSTLSDKVSTLSETVATLSETVSRHEAQAESDRQETREAINNLIIANEVTRKLSEDVANFALSTNQRVTILENRP